MKKLFLLKLTYIFLLLFSIIYCIEAFRLKLGSVSSPGPGFVPFLAGIFLACISAISFLITYRNKTAFDAENEEMTFSHKTLLKPVKALAALLAYSLILVHLGYLISTFLLMLFLFKGIESQRWVTGIISAILATALSYLIFGIWLGVEFP